MKDKNSAQYNSAQPAEKSNSSDTAADKKQLNTLESTDKSEPSDSTKHAEELKPPENSSPLTAQSPSEVSEPAEETGGATSSDDIGSSEVSEPAEETGGATSFDDIGSSDDPEVKALLEKSWTSMVPELKGVWKWFAQKYCGELSIPEKRLKQLREAAKKGTIVYVIRTQSYLNYFIYNVLFLRYGLPLARFAPGLFGIPWQPLAFRLKVVKAWIARLFGGGGEDPKVLFREFVKNRIPTMIFLNRPVTLITYIRRFIYKVRDTVRKILGLSPAPGGKQVDLLKELIEIQRQTDREIFVCPQILVWDRAPASARQTFWDVLFGDKESPGIIRELYQFLRNKKQSRVYGDPPISLKEYLKKFPEDKPAEEISKILKEELDDSFEREYRVITGPKFRPAEELKAEVLSAQKVREAIEREAREKGISIEAAQRRAERILNRMAAKFDISIARRLDWFLRIFWNRMFRSLPDDLPNLGGIDVDREGLEKMRAAAKKAPLVIIPSHKSHVDYLVMSQVMLHNDIIPPHIAAGDNLLMPIIGWIFRRSGAFFIRRKFGNDQLYKAIFSEYLLTLLREGSSIEFFIEGGRSRSGKLRQPKMGMLSFLIDAFLNPQRRDKEPIRDFYIVPVSIGYDRIVEGESYSRELLGESKKRESILGLFRSALDFLKLDFGRIAIRIAEPFSVREAIDQLTREYRKQNPDFDPESNLEDRKLLVRNLAYRIVYDINRVSPITPSAMTATLLMTSTQRGLAEEELQRELEWLREEMSNRRAEVLHFDNSKAVVERTVKFLRRLIKIHNFQWDRVYRAKASRRLELAYYRNQLLHLFVSEGIVACSLNSFPCRRADDEGVEKSKLLESVKFLSWLLKKEFIYKPSPDIQDNFEETLEGLRRKGVLDISPDGKIKERGYIDGNFNYMEFLRRLFWPFIDSYWAAALGHFFLLEEERPLDERKFIKKLQTTAEYLYQRGIIIYSDSVSKENFQNALSLFREKGLYRAPEDAEKDSKKARLYALSEEFSSKGALLEFIDQIGMFSSSREWKRFSRQFYSLAAGEHPTPLITHHQETA